MTQENVRIERDSLGEVMVPANALYGAQTQRAVLNFPVSDMRPYRAFIWSMALIKRAAAEVNYTVVFWMNNAPKPSFRPARRSWPVNGTINSL